MRPNSRRNEGGLHMLRIAVGAIAGVLLWYGVVFAVSYGIKAAAPGLDAALVAHTGMAALLERLAIGFFASLVSGFAAALIAGERWRAPLAAGVILLVIFVPYHLTIWQQFPIWYHLTFFASLPLLSLAGGRSKR